LFATAGLLSTKAQLTNTSWQGIFKMPEPTKMILQFKSDSLFFNDPETGNNFEAMSYELRNDTLTFIKLSGNSSCSTTDKGMYKVEIKDDHLFMSLINDECYDRPSAIPEEGLSKL